MSSGYEIIEAFEGFYIKKLGRVDFNTLSNDLNRRQLQVDISKMMRDLVNADIGQQILIVAKQQNFSAPVVIAVSPGKMSAVLTLNIKPGEKTIPLDEFFQRLKDQGIVYGVNLERVKTLLKLKRPAFREVIATGEPPQNGNDAKINYYFQEPSLNPLPDKNDFVFRPGGIIPVEEGEVLATRTPATIGVFGCNVLGEIVLPLPGKNLDFNVGSGISVEVNSAVAIHSGALHWDNSIMTVVSLTTLSGDSQSGEVFIPGKAIITGNLSSNTTIIAEGDIEIQGNIEGGTVISETGSVYVRDGIIGNSRSIVKADGNVEASYVYKTIIEAKQNLIVDKYILQSDLTVGQGIYCKAVKQFTFNDKRDHPKPPPAEVGNDIDLLAAAKSSKDLERELKYLIKSIQGLIKKTDATNQVRELLERYVETSNQLNKLKKERQDFINRQKKNSLGLQGLFNKPGIDYRIRYEKVPDERITPPTTVFYDYYRTKLFII
ncbi:MAG: DUF342 domain-containing protein [Syntrophomonadaceae bacterium]|nr:DUF342 domain-containing protein [Syntrophomonadaceae bacterium]